MNVPRSRLCLARRLSPTKLMGSLQGDHHLQIHFLKTNEHIATAEVETREYKALEDIVSARLLRPAYHVSEAIGN